MKKVWLSLMIVGLLAAVACSRTSRQDPLGSSAGSGSGGSGGGSGGGGGGATPTPVLTPFVILANGVTSAWMSRTITAEFNTSGAMGAGPADPISGQTSTMITVPQHSAALPLSFSAVAWLRLTTCPIGTTIQCPYPIYPDGFLARGHITFNLKLDLPISEIDAAYIVWGNPNCGLHHYDLPFAQLSSTNFVRFDVDLDAFSYPNTGACSLPPTTAFQINIERIGPTSTNGGFSIADIEWQAP